MVTDLFPAFADIWTPAKDALVGHDTDGKEIYGCSVVLPAHDFWGHIARCATRVLSIFFTPYTGDTEVGDS